jgi:hypothetical protein
MLPKKELQALAGALKATSEYTDTTRLRRRIMESAMGRTMQSFEREHTRLLNLGLPEKESAERLKKLYAGYNSFLGQPAVREYIKAAQGYQKTVSESIEYLNGLLDMGGPANRL